jgi:hypothetical protein
VNEAERNQIHAGLVKAGLLPRESGLR